MRRRAYLTYLTLWCNERSSRCPGGPPSCSQGYRSARDSSAITLDFAAHTCLDDIVTEVCATGCPIVASRLHQTGQQRLLKRRYQRLLCSLHLHPVTSGWRHEAPGVLPGSSGFLVPHRRQTVALLSSLYILNVLHFNKTNTEVMAGYDVGSLCHHSENGCRR